MQHTRLRLHLALATLLASTACAGLGGPAPGTAVRAPAPPLPGGLRYTVAVTELRNESGWEGQLDVGNAWHLAVVDALSRSFRFIVVGDAETRAAVLEEQDLAASGRAAAGGRQNAATGRMTTAQLLISGAVLHVQKESRGGLGDLDLGGVRLGGSREVVEVRVALEVTDASTGQVVASTLVTGEAVGNRMSLSLDDSAGQGNLTTFQADNLGKALIQAAENAVAWAEGELPGIPWSGTVAQVDGQDVYVNRGSREGVRIGQTFVVGEVEMVTDPVTGEVLHETMNEMARLDVREVMTKVSICEVVSGDPRALHDGLAVRLP